VITPVMADHIRDALDRAEREGHQALLVQLDTPGGLDTSMRDIIQSFLNARVPVIVFVSPRGARAASAGALITLASHVAVMAPGTAMCVAGGLTLEDWAFHQALACFKIAVISAGIEHRRRAGQTAGRGPQA
jgi:membrane-bound serine protease (ClpP class)